jgi:uncharacterized repeat protein (TIGR01451 family)
VASVSDRGVVTARAVGVTTLRVMVDGVTGTFPLAVRQPFTLTAPPVAVPGSAVTATTTFPNTGPAALRNVRMTLTGPAGWTVAATSPASYGTVASGQTVRTTWAITAPADAAPGSYPLAASVTFSGPTGQGSSGDAAGISVPFASLSSAFDNPGISDDSNPSKGNLDGGGFSYSAQALAAAGGLTPGASVTHDGITFTWPNAQPGTPDNVVAGGQTVPVSGSGATLGLLGSGDYGAASGTGTVTYADGTTQQFDITFPDWWSNTAPSGGDILVTEPYLNTPTGKLTQATSIYYIGVPLQKGKAVRYVTLPDVSQGAVQNQVAMHIFAVGIG